MRPIVNSNKHYVQVSLASITAANQLNTTIATAKDVPASGNASQVRSGSVIKAVFVEMWVRGGETSPGSVLITLEKVPGSGTLPTFAEHVALHTYDNKKNILYHTQGLTNNNTADAIPFVRGWFKIPKGKQRFGLDDTLNLGIAAQALDSIVCGFMTYKEYN